MAPSPEYDKEPKAPDKSATSNSIENTRVRSNSLIEQQSSLDSKSSNASAVSAEAEDTKDVETLDDGQLRALLDEAITYKCPKDREGKSSLFKELLEEVEQDEQACEEAARAWGGRRGRGARARHALPHSNSLQDLVAAALAAEPAPRRRPPPPVSARTLHGGSLPSGVDTSFLLGEDPPRGARPVEYVATVHCENPSPLGERRVSASDAQSPAETDPLNRRSKMAAFPMTYTARATLEIGSGSVCSGRAVTTTTASNQVDAGIPFSCISSPEVVCSPAPAAALEHKKALDENGNSVQTYGSPLSTSALHKKQRRKKSSKNETEIKPQEIDGYQGNKELDELLRFIESTEEQGRAKHKKRAERRHKDKDTRKRANSMEELSRTKLEDLTDKPAPAADPPDRRSWDFYRAPEPESDTAVELLDFQTVTKKKKQRKRPEDPPADRLPRAASPSRRRQSAPPSDKSNDSNDDMDSVHSLPAAPRAPAASYADIARTRHNIPDLIESCNYYEEGGGRDAPVPAIDADSYPALSRSRRKSPRAPDVLGERRPAVVLPASRPPDLDGVTFGFDINEQLLAAPPLDLLPAPAKAAVRVRVGPGGGAAGGGGAGGGGGTLRYLPPPHAPCNASIVHYVGTAWEDVLKCVGGKVRYFSE